MSDFTVAEAEEMISRTGGTLKEMVSTDVKLILHKRPGLKVLAAIDFLVNHKKYRWTKKEGK